MKKLIVFISALLAVALAGCTQEAPVITSRPSVTPASQPLSGVEYIAQYGLNMTNQDFDTAAAIICQGMADGAGQVGVTGLIRDNLGAGRITEEEAFAVLQAIVTYECPWVTLYEDPPGYTLTTQDEIGVRVLADNGIKIEPYLFARIGRQVCRMRDEGKSYSDTIDYIVETTDADAWSAVLVSNAVTIQYCAHWAPTSASDLDK